MGRPRIYPKPVKGRRGAVPGRRREEVPADTLAAIRAPGINGWGPAMEVLDDRRKAFVLELYAAPLGQGSAAGAARRAGFGTAKSSALSMEVIASRLMHDDRVVAAFAEEDKRRIRRAAPRAIRALERLVEDPDHKDHARSISMILDRTHPVETRHEVSVVHRVDHDAEAVAQLRTLKSLDVAREKLIEVFGFSGLGRYERLLEQEQARENAKSAPKLIEMEPIEEEP